jgi:archaellum biogenesis ATPase FlaH
MLNTSDDFETLVEQGKAEETARNERLSKVSITSGAELMQKSFPEPRYLWNSVLPDSGLAVMAASKAAGKTLLLLQLASAISKGRDFLGLPTKLTKTLFLELELSERRTQQRLLKMGIVADRMLSFANKWTPGDEGLKTITDAIKEHDYGLVIVDVMQMLWPMDADSNSYQDVYSVLSPLRQIANDLGVMIVLVTHRRKMQTDDYLDGVIGSVGIAANADVLFSLIRTRGEQEAVLHIDGNDIESKKIALRFNVDPLGFCLSSTSPEEIGLTPERREIIEAIRRLGGTAKPGQVASVLSKERSNVGHAMQTMAEHGILEIIGTGIYTLKNPIPTVPTIPTLEADRKTGNDGNTGNGTLGGNIPTDGELF